MANERDDARPDDDREILDPEDVSSPPSKELQASEAPEPVPSADPAAEIPVPIVMSPAEIDERAQAVEAVRGNRESRREAQRDPDSGDPDSRMEG